jgi:hypothetical protein
MKDKHRANCLLDTKYFTIYFNSCGFLFGFEKPPSIRDLYLFVGCFSVIVSLPSNSLNENQNEELKRCPFCKSYARLGKDVGASYDNATTWYRVGCCNCKTVK